MKSLVKLIQARPVRFQGLIQSGIALAIGFGAGITNEQMGLLLAFTASVLALITETQVNPKPRD